MTPGVIEKKWRHHDDLAITVNDADPCHIAIPFFNADKFLRDCIQADSNLTLANVYLNLTHANDLSHHGWFNLKVRSYF